MERPRLLATKVATPPTAAVFRNLRRSTPLFFDFDMSATTSVVMALEEQASDSSRGG